LKIETASQRPATLKDFRTQQLAPERQIQQWELSKFEPIGTRQEEIAKKFCRFRIREEGSRLNIAQAAENVEHNFKKMPPRLDFACFHRLAMSSADAGAETLLQSA
jgi:hypothetical protein